MYCSNCGNKIEETTQFCQNCGNKIHATTTDADKQAATSDRKIPEALFYSENWQQTRIFVRSTLPCFDILITKDFLYLISLPAHSFSDGLIMFSVLGEIIRGPLNRKVRNKFRSNWLDSNHKLISQDYEKSTLLKVPIDKLKDTLLFKKSFRQKLAIFTYDGEKITLQGSKSEYERFSKYVESNLDVFNK